MNKEYIFWLLLGIVFIAALAILTFFTIKSFNNVESPANKKDQQMFPSAGIEKSTESNGNKVIIKDSDPNSRLIYYRDGRFVPREIKVENKGDEGSCFVTIVNNSQENLEIRLGEYKNEPYQGPNYDLIPPQGNLILDPRFRIPEVIFYNRNTPSAEFKVILGTGCALD